MRTFLLILFSIVPFLMSLFYFLPADPAPGFMLLLAATKGFLFMAPFFFWKVMKLPGSWRDFPRYFSLDKLRRHAGLGSAVGVIMSAAVICGYFFLISEVTRAPAQARIETKISVLNIRDHFLIYGAVLSFIHSLLEEFYWRFFIFQAWKEKLKKGRKITPHLIAGAAFTLHHFTVTIHYFDLWFGLALGLGVWIAALTWSSLFEKERSLWSVWISHIIVDLALISIGYHAINS